MNSDNGSVNVYVLPGDPITLIDTGLPTEKSFQQLKSGLQSKGLCLEDLQQIIVTHMHDDHMGGINQIQKETAVPVYVSKQAEAEVTEGPKEYRRRERFLKDFFKQCGAEQMKSGKSQYINTNWENVHFLEDGERINAGGRKFEVLEVPGHSQSDICIWDPQSGDVFAGDFLLNNISANAFISPPALHEKHRPYPLLQLRDSFKRVYDFPFGTIYPGHGESFRGHRKLIDKRRDEHEQRCQEIYRILQSSIRTTSGISVKMFPWLKAHSKFLGLSEIQGHLDLMLHKGQIYSEQDRGVVCYKTYDSFN